MGLNRGQSKFNLVGICTTSIVCLNVFFVSMWVIIASLFHGISKPAHIILRKYAQNLGFTSFNISMRLLYPSRFVVYLENHDSALASPMPLHVFKQTLLRQHNHIVISNHQTYLDWLYHEQLACLFGKASYLVYMMKAGVKNIPIFGRAVQSLSHIFLERDWKQDQLILEESIKSLLCTFDSTYILIFPEGTIIDENGMNKCMAFVEKQRHCIPPHYTPKYCLVPRTSGLYHLIMQYNNDNLDSIIDVTMGVLPSSCGDDTNNGRRMFPGNQYPIINSLVRRIYPKEIHFHVRCISPNEVPKDPQLFATWLKQLFISKDKRLEQFYEQETFLSPTCSVAYDGHIPRGSVIQYLLFVSLMVGLTVSLLVRW